MMVPSLPLDHCNIMKHNDFWMFCWWREGSIGSATRRLLLWWHLPCSDDGSLLVFPSGHHPHRLPLDTLLVLPLTLVGNSIVLVGLHVGPVGQGTGIKFAHHCLFALDAFLIFEAKLLAWRHGQSMQDNTNPFVDDVRRDWYVLRVGWHGERVAVEAMAERGLKKYCGCSRCFGTGQLQMFSSRSKMGCRAAPKYG